MTNEERRARAAYLRTDRLQAALKRYWSRGRLSALQVFAIYWTSSTPPPRRLVAEEALVEIEQRLAAAHVQLSTGRTRKKIKWLGRWAQRINATLEAA